MNTEPEPKKKGLKKVRKKLDKILLGVVVGGAVGSILGLTLAPKSGKETRKIIGEKSRDTWKKVSDIIEERKEKQIHTQEKKEKRGFWHTLNRWFIKKKK